MLIRRAGDSDIGPALGLIRDAFKLPLGGPPTVHTFVHGLPGGQLFVAVDGERLIGTGASVSFGSTGWIGGIAVEDSFRGAGLGRALTEAALAALVGCETVLLLASEAGRPIYERLGFVAEERFRVFLTGEAPVRATHREFRVLTRTDADAVLALDARVTGEDRSAAVLASVDGAVALPDLSAVALRPPWRALPIIGAGGAELIGALVGPGTRVAAPETNSAAVAMMASVGVERASVVRMRRGPRVAWRPDEVCGVFSLFFG